MWPQSFNLIPYNLGPFSWKKCNIPDFRPFLRQNRLSCLTLTFVEIFDNGNRLFGPKYVRNSLLWKNQRQNIFDRQILQQGPGKKIMSQTFLKQTISDVFWPKKSIPVVDSRCRKKSRFPLSKISANVRVRQKSQFCLNFGAFSVKINFPVLLLVLPLPDQILRNPLCFGTQLVQTCLSMLPKFQVSTFYTVYGSP